MKGPLGNIMKQAQAMQENFKHWDVWRRVGRSDHDMSARCPAHQD